VPIFDQELMGDLLMGSEKIIIVDDEIDVLDLCKRILETKGYQVTTARNGQEVVEFAKKEHFDLLLTDIRMPGMSGLEVAQAIKQFASDVICVTMTGYSTMDMAIEALKLGIDDFIMKPFSPDELGMAISKALDKERLRKENFRLRSLIPLFELNKTLLGTIEVEEVLRQLVDIAKTEIKADFARIYTFDAGEFVAHFEPEDQDEADVNQTLASCQLAKFVFEEGQQLLLSAQSADEQQRVLLEQLAIEFAIATPLKSKKTNLGALILARSQNEFAASDGNFLSVLAGQASIALENAHLFKEIQEAYEELKMLDHMKSEFINIAAHELRTPLAILMGYASMLEDDLQGVQRDYMATIMRNSLRLTHLIDDMLSLQSLETGRITLAKDPLNLPEAVQAAIDDLALWAEQKNLIIEVDIPPDFPQMIADRQKFDLIIVNLLNNAVKFTPADGHIFFKARVTPENMATISVTNTGVSIPKKELSRVFDRFYQVEKSLTREHGGIGLGLSIARGMVNACGGEIYADSEEGQSTTFSFTLPLNNSHLKERTLKIKNEP
jgi:signal transduction histidine kinase/ActR/RegA family two-component response regulator